MATEQDEELLWKKWNREDLGEYEGKWIAFRGEVLESHESLEALSESYSRDIEEGNGPLFAFVSFEIRA